MLGRLKSQTDAKSLVAGFLYGDKPSRIAPGSWGYSVGFEEGYSDALTVDDIKGGFFNGSVRGGDGVGGSVDFFTGESPNGQVYGGGATIGTAAGMSVTSAHTNTIACTTISGCH